MAETIVFERQKPAYFQRKGFEGRYLVYLPEGYSAAARWPLVLFLHGSRERGEDLEAVTRHGPPRLVKEGQEFPFVLISPQLPASQFWSAPWLAALLDEVEQHWAIDPQRSYVTGLSMGGYGTWLLAMHQPQRFAAIAPIACPDRWERGASPQYTASQLCRMKDLPVWAFHGQLDTVVPVQLGQNLVEAFEACGGKARWTVYPTADHDAWTATYHNPDFWSWLLAQKKPT